jgi:hypothetical protein
MISGLTLENCPISFTFLSNQDPLVHAPPIARKSGWDERQKKKLRKNDK